jgi:hypothetical protein
MALLVLAQPLPLERASSLNLASSEKNLAYLSLERG